MSKPKKDESLDRSASVATFVALYSTRSVGLVVGFGDDPAISLCSLAQPYLIKSPLTITLRRVILRASKSCLDVYGVALVSYVLSVCYALGLSWAGMRMLVRLRQWLFERVLPLP